MDYTDWYSLAIVAALVISVIVNFVLAAFLREKRRIEKGSWEATLQATHERIQLAEER